jgi:hypothetical protein
MQPEAEAMQVMDQSQMGNAVGTATPEPVPEGVVGEAKLMAEIKHEEEVVHENESSTDAAAAATGSDKTPIEAAQAHPIGETAAEAAHEKAESLARTAEVDAMAQDEVARAAEAMLNGGPSTPAAMSALEAQRRLAHANEMCTLGWWRTRASSPLLFFFCLLCLVFFFSSVCSHFFFFFCFKKLFFHRDAPHCAAQPAPPGGGSRRAVHPARV